MFMFKSFSLNVWESPARPRRRISGPNSLSCPPGAIGESETGAIGESETGAIGESETGEKNYFQNYIAPSCYESPT